MSGRYVKAVASLQARVEPFAKGLKVRMPRWISTPDGDLGTEWCSDCGYFKVRNLRRRDPKRREEYILDGGWRTEEEHFCSCINCGVQLDICLTDYGLASEIEHYETGGYSTSIQTDAYEIGQMLDAVEWRDDKEKPEARERRQAVVAIARGFLKQAPRAAR